jgi:hypothetical protein
MTHRCNRHRGPSWTQRDREHSRDPRSHSHHGPYGHQHHGKLNVSPEQQALRSTAAEVARLFAIANRSSLDTVEKQAQLRVFLERSRKELSDMIYGTTPSTSQATAAAGSKQA